MLYEIKHRYTGAVLFSAQLDAQYDTESESIKLGAAVKMALKAKANLRGSDLSHSDLSHSNLRGSDLSGSDLRGSDLSGSDLSGSDLRGSDLSGSDLSGSNLSYSKLRGSDLSGSDLRGSDLRGSDLSGSDLRGSDLSGSNLRGSNLSYSKLRGSDLSHSNLSGSDLSHSDLSHSNLSGSDLSGSDLRGSDLSGSNLSGSNLRGAKNADLAIARTRILPQGSIIGWKQCRGGVLVKLRVPEEAKRSHAFGRKCRAEFVDVLEVIGGEEGISQHDRKTAYRVGERVHCDKWESDWQQECAGGIHFYITKEEAEAHA